MKKMNKPYLSINQASFVYLLFVVTMIFIPVILRPLVGFGGSLIFNQLILILLPTFVVCWRSKYPWVQMCRFKKVSKKVVGLAILGGIGVWLTNAYIILQIEQWLYVKYGNLLPFREAIDAVEKSFGNPGLNVMLYLIGALILSPICEEIFFRGMLQGAFAKYNLKWSWVISGILFGAAHFGNQISNGVANILHGWVLAYLLYRTGSIWPSILLHASNNVIATLIGGPVLVQNPEPFLSPMVPLIGVVIVFGVLWQIRKEANAVGHGNTESLLPEEGSWETGGALRIDDRVEKVDGDVLEVDEERQEIEEVAMIGQAGQLEQSVEPVDKLPVGASAEVQILPTDHFREGMRQLHEKPKLTFRTFVFFGLAFLLFFSIIQLEIGIRTGAVAVGEFPETAQADFVHLNGQHIVHTLNIVEPTQLDFGFELEGQFLDVLIYIMDEQGNHIFEKEYRGIGMEIVTELQIVQIELPGKYFVKIQGVGDDVFFKFNWLVK